MKKLLFTAVSTVCLIASLAGCHKKAAPATLAAKYVDFVLTPDATAKTVTIECTGSSSGKCSFAFDGGTPTDVMIDAGAKVTVTGVTPGGNYCYGLSKLDMATCHAHPIPDQKTTVNRERPAGPAVPASN